MSRKEPVKWNDLQSLPPLASNVYFNNNNELLAMEFISCFPTKYHLYDSQANTFNQFILPHDTKCLRCWEDNISFDSKEQKLYGVEHWDHDYIYSMDINTGTCKSFEIPTEASLPETCKSFDINNIYFLAIENRIHIIKNYNNHWIGSIDNNNKCLNTVQNISQNDECALAAAAIYVSSKQCIVLIGGWYEEDWCEFPPLRSDIWVYSLTSQKWTKMDNVWYKRFNFNAVLTSDERYILLLGGYKYVEGINDDEETNDIFVLDMKDDNNWK
eukprot:349409_1